MKTLVPAALLVLSGSALAQTVHVVDPTGQGDFLFPQDAIDAAESGDTILIRSPFANSVGLTIDGKSLTISRADSSPVQVGPTRIENIPAGGYVVWNGVDIRHFDAFFPGMLIDSCTGPVTVQGSRIEGSTGNPFAVGEFDGLEVNESTQVVVTDCELIGTLPQPASPGGSPGGSGIEAKNSTLFVYDSLLAGGEGKPGESVSLGAAVDGGFGGNGLNSTGSIVQLENSVLTGGMGGVGGTGIVGPCSDGGRGGTALFQAGGFVRYREVTFVPGEGGTASPGCNSGFPGEEIDTTPFGTAVLDGFSSSYGWSPNPIREFEPGVATHRGNPGDSAFVLLGFSQTALYASEFQSGLLVDLPISVVPVPPIPASGLDTFPVGLGELGPGLQTFSLTIQLITFNAAEGFSFGSRQVVTILDSGL